MKKKVILTSIVSLCFAMPAFAEFTAGQQIADENGLLNGMACDEDTLGVTQDTANLEAIWTANEYACTSGQYLFVGQENNQDVVECRTCPSGSYCGGAPQNSPYTVESHANDILSCSTVGDGSYTLSYGGATSNTDCYRNCSVNDVPHATSVKGGVYYDGNTGNNQCGATICNDGYHIVGTLNGMTIDTGGDPSDRVGGATGNNTWSVDMGFATIFGSSMCGSTAPVNNEIISPYDIMIQNSPGDTNCWCNIDSIAPAGASNDQIISSAPIFAFNFESGIGCRENCASYCAGSVLGEWYDERNEHLLDALIGTLQGFNGSCVGNSIDLHWWNDSPENDGTAVPVQNAARSCTYGGSLTIPDAQHIPEKAGYTFGGWKIGELGDLVNIKR